MSNAHRMGRMLLLALVVLLLWTPGRADAATSVFWTATVTQPRVGQDIGFSAIGDGTTYAWNFGDGGTATGDAPTHSFSSPGSTRTPGWATS